MWGGRVGVGCGGEAALGCYRGGGGGGVLLRAGGGVECGIAGFGAGGGGVGGLVGLGGCWDGFLGGLREHC